MTTVLDASALLAYLLDESGAEPVEEAIADGVAISTVNLTEVFTRLADVRPDLGDLFVRLADGIDAQALPRSVPSLGPGGPVLPETITVEPFLLSDAMTCAALRPRTRAQGLSLGDRACLALGHRLHALVLTADRRWLELDESAMGLDGEIRAIR